MKADVRVHSARLLMFWGVSEGLATGGVAVQGSICAQPSRRLNLLPVSVYHRLAVR
jgi:hypothetical protein